MYHITFIHSPHSYEVEVLCATSINMSKPSHILLRVYLTNLCSGVILYCCIYTQTSKCIHARPPYKIIMVLPVTPPLLLQWCTTTTTIIVLHTRISLSLLALLTPSPLKSRLWQYPHYSSATTAIPLLSQDHHYYKLLFVVEGSRKL